MSGIQIFPRELQVQTTSDLIIDATPASRAIITADDANPFTDAEQTAVAALSNNVSGDGTVSLVVKLTQVAYDAIGSPVATTLYVIVD